MSDGRSDALLQRRFSRRASRTAGSRAAAMVAVRPRRRELAAAGSAASTRPAAAARRRPRAAALASLRRASRSPTRRAVAPVEVDRGAADHRFRGAWPAAFSFSFARHNQRPENAAPFEISCEYRACALFSMAAATRRPEAGASGAVHDAVDPPEAATVPSTSAAVSVEAPLPRKRHTHSTDKIWRASRLGRGEALWRASRRASGARRRRPRASRRRRRRARGGGADARPLEGGDRAAPLTRRCSATGSGPARPRATVRSRRAREGGGRARAGPRPRRARDDDDDDDDPRRRRPRTRTLSVRRRRPLLARAPPPTPSRRARVAGDTPRRGRARGRVRARAARAHSRALAPAARPSAADAARAAFRARSSSTPHKAAWRAPIAPLSRAPRERIGMS